MYLITKQVFPMGAQTAVRFKLHDADVQPIQVQARVLYIHEGIGIGLGFVDLDPVVRARIAKFIEHG
jgi:hypothetical protein